MARSRANDVSAQDYFFPFQDFFKNFNIEPRTNWERFINPQFYITYNSGDLEIENQVLKRVGSYGKQLGRIIDALNVVIAHLPPDALAPEALTSRERLALDKFRELRTGVEAALTEVRWPEPEDVTVDVERLIAELRALERTDPAIHRRLVARLRDAVSPDEGE